MCFRNCINNKRFVYKVLRKLVRLVSLIVLDLFFMILEVIWWVNFFGNWSNIYWFFCILNVKFLIIKLFNVLNWVSLMLKKIFINEFIIFLKLFKNLMKVKNLEICDILWVINLIYYYYFVDFLI